MIQQMRFKPLVNVVMLLRMIGWLLIIEAGFMLIPLVSAIIYNDSEISDFAISSGFTAAVGFILMRLKPRSRDMGKREAILLTSMTWIILSLFGMIPFLLSGTHPGVTDAFFESMNGFTTTGASVLTTVKSVSHSILLWRSIQQWIGGMGIILFTLAIVPMLNNQGGMFLFNAEVTGITHDKLRPRISSTAKGLWMVYITLTALLILLFAFSDMNLFEAICQGLSTMSTGGFSTRDMNFEAWGSMYVKIVATIFMAIGGVNFALLYKASMGKFKDLVRSTVLRWYLAIIVISYLLLAINILLNGAYQSIEDITIDPLFQAVSTISSTGISEPDFQNWGLLSTIVLVVMMFTGACAGSTSGGAKLDRMVIMLKFIKNEFFKLMHPNNVTTVSINGKGTSYMMVQKVLAFLCLYVIVIFVGGTLLTFCGLPLKESFFYCLSCISNTGIGTDIVGIGGGFSTIPDIAKWILSGVMLVGRLELYTVLLIFTPIFWEK
jgi:trk system potassium uptake protein TrkH